jgi:hypothetical protein
MTGSRATGIACLAGTKAVSSRHRRSPLVLCSTTHRGSSRDRSHPGRRRKASKGSAIPAVPHLAQLQSPIYQWVLTGLPGSTLLALGVLQEGPTFTALSVFLSRGDRVPRDDVRAAMVFALSGGFCRFHQAATAGSLKIGSSLNGAMVSRVM